MDIIIRRFRKEDAIKVGNIVKRGQRKVLVKYYPKKLMEAFCKRNNPKRVLERAKNRQYFVAENKKTKKILGGAALKGNEVTSYYVDPQKHRRGIGKMLFERIKKEALKKGHKKLYVSSSLYAVDFYKKVGFRRLRKKHRELDGIKFYDIWMVNKIK